MIGNCAKKKVDNRSVFLLVYKLGVRPFFAYKNVICAFYTKKRVEYWQLQ